MTEFTDATRDDTSLLIAIAGASGSGKTFSALTMATGLAQGEPIYAIDTEAKRMLHYADQFKFKHMDMRPPFTPEAYIEAIQKA
ncbi:AAA family ATPase [Rhizobium sp. TH135]|uniref:AAA family ATPase n=1 Tax=Rhizobium sp. TH135 TaxID=2067451 RepID=UPI001FE17A8B|nr:AAA family ATPase [Rhizobium sp. TH135]